MAVTVVVKPPPAVWAAPAVTERIEAAAGLTVTPDDVPLIEPVTVSVAVTVRLPAVFNVYAFVNVWAPLSPPTKV